MSEGALPFYRKILLKEFQRRLKKNPSYSLRSYARGLGMAGGPLSQILSGKRYLSAKAAEKILDLIDAPPADRSRFLQSLAETRIKAGARRLSPALRSTVKKSGILLPAAKDLPAEIFSVIADWHHYAILEMAQASEFDANPQQIASRLGISPAEAKLARDRLIRLGLLSKIGNKWKKVDTHLSTHDKDRSSTAHRKRQRQILEKSLFSLLHDPIQFRNHSSITFSIDPDRIPEARPMIEAFFWKLSEFLGQKPKTVYEMQVALFPLEKNIHA